ncbi:hypothetical protein LCGC14_1457570 [marine sediment metagenome]|uniref:Uncharacterized protein n=1 Tax=marine sediment metagenome TaxID=412755 RepID=A0A0F9MI21_9ZZZZ
MVLYIPTELWGDSTHILTKDGSERQIEHITEVSVHTSPLLCKL